ncbi:PREDICTED: uncharacterized protein LOC106125661 [Papilio xuthus]|uniref:Uncharacterized protein LOC106125661 n=1 Tax=Papilio xuthus TaxID=66420 RepID=A0AAJ6ZSH4_PAPXU|nr:PREDICTED: uncharacterized protein LOC106125661 [Papilio xuthus]
MHVKMLTTILLMLLINLTFAEPIRRYQNKKNNQNTVCTYTGLHGRCYDPNQVNNYDAPHVKKHYRNAKLSGLKKKQLQSRVNHPYPMVKSPYNPYENSHKKHGRNKQIHPSIYNDQQYRPYPQTSKFIPDLPFLFKDYEQWFGNYDELYFVNKYPEV